MAHPIVGAGTGRDDAPTSAYRELAPPPRLSAHILCLWTQSIGGGGVAHPQRILPDACVDVVWIDDAPPVVAGPATRAVVVPLPPRSTVVGARCRPGSAPVVLGVSAAELLDREVALRDVCRPLAGRLEAAPAGRRPASAARLAAVEAALTAHLADTGPADALVAAAIVWLAEHPGEPVHRLDRAVGASGRQLRRRFGSAVGYGPKTFHRILRFQRLLALARRTPVSGGRLSRLALAAGYADQAHMTREVQRLADRPPAALLSTVDTTLAMADFFKTALHQGG